MKKMLLAATVCGVVAGSAHAQSSVTLYGIADAGLLFTNNVKGLKQYALTSGNEGSSRWGLTGSEDLGGGLRAIFDVESGYSVANGTIAVGGTLFGRQAYVGLSSNTYGTVTAGRLYSVGYAAVGPLSAGDDWAASGLGYGAHAGDVDNMDTFNRIANAVSFQSASYNGLKFAGLYSFGGQAGQFSKNSVVDAAVSYANGPVKLGLGYTFTKDPNFATFGNQAGSSTTGSNMTNPIFSGYATAGSQQIIAAGGAYALGPVTLGAIYTNTQFQKLGTVNVGTPSLYKGGVATFNTGELNVKYNVTPALLLATSYAYTHNSGAGGLGGAHYNQVNLGAVYSLSKQTSLYAIGFFEAAAGTDSTGKQAVAALSGLSYSSTSRQVAATIGMTHRF
jgi:predicted porin